MHSAADLKLERIDTMAISTNLGRLVMRGSPLFNAPIVALAASPRFGKMLRRSITLITYTGRRSGRTFSMPVAYRRRGEEIEIAPNMPDATTWWRTFLGDRGLLALS